MHRAFKAHYRRILPELLGTLEFRCANPSTQPVMQALHVFAVAENDRPFMGFVATNTFED